MSIPLTDLSSYFALGRKNLIQTQSTGGTEGRSDSLGLGKLSAVEALVAQLSGRGPPRTRRSADIQRLAHLTPRALVAQHS
jgi:hypothetical protein